MIFRALISFALALSVAVSAQAAPLASAQTKYTHSEIYAERAGFVPGETTWFAFRQEIVEHWHVFWLNPGDAGLPLAFNWELPRGFEPGDIIHPAPEHIPVGDMLASYAHEGEPVFLVPVSVPAKAKIGDVINVAIDASWQACEEMCVPEEAQFSFSLPVVDADAAPPSENQSLFESARAAVPVAIDNAAQFKRMGERYELTIADWTGAAPDSAFFFPEDFGLVLPVAEQTVSVESGVLTIGVTPGWIDGPAGDIVSGVVQTRSNGRTQSVALTSEVAPGIAAPASGAPRASANIAFMALLAFLGGLLLNAMPCVFPILFVKAASLMASAQHDPATTRMHGLAYGGGVVASFILIAGALILLRAGGEQLGWGFHLQSPGVTGLSAYILLGVGLSLAGVFTIGESLSGAGDQLTRKSGAAGSFFTGILAVVVAAPCIGPLLTAPMASALSAPAHLSMVIFIAMALGLAAPFTAVAFAPGLGRMLPKPGPWMAIFKQALSFPVFAAAAYFVWVFARQTGDGALGGLLAGIVLLTLAAWLFQHSKGEGARAIVFRVGAALALLGAIAPLMNARPATAAQAIDRYGALPVEPFSIEAIADHHAQGRSVFTIFTAAWCVTCQADKLTVFSSEKLAQEFADANTVIMVADWTLRDEIVSNALEELGGFGVPFYALYPAGDDAIALAPPISRQHILEKLHERR